MNEEDIRKQIHQAVDDNAQGMQLNPFLAQRVIAQAAGKEAKPMKKKMSFIVVLTSVLLLAVTALAITLLTPKQVVETVAVPLARNNDEDWRIHDQFSPEELAQFIKACSENGIDLDENSLILEALRSGEGYSEEETVMELSRKAFGGMFSEWKVADRHWFTETMNALGYKWEIYPMPGPDDLPEEEAKRIMLAAVYERYGADLPLEDREQYILDYDYFAEPKEDGTVWQLFCDEYHDTSRDFIVRMDRQGNVLSVEEIEDIDPRIAIQEMYTLPEEEVLQLAVAALKDYCGEDFPADDPAVFTPQFSRHSDETAIWDVTFLSRVMEQGDYTVLVWNDTKKAVVLQVGDGTLSADNIVDRYRNAYGWYGDWEQSKWVQLSNAVKDLPASTTEGKVMKATEYIPWREGLLTRNEAEKAAYISGGFRLGDTNQGVLINAEPNPVWHFLIYDYEGIYPDGILIEVDAVTGKRVGLEQYKSQYDKVDPGYRTYTLLRTWARVTLEEEGPLPLAYTAVYHTFGDMSLDCPDEELPIEDARYWKPEINGNSVRLRSLWLEYPDYCVTLDENGMVTDIREEPTSGTEPIPEELKIIPWEPPF